MQDPGRIDEMVELVRALWRKYPEWRLGQLVLNAHSIVIAAQEDAYFAEDDVLERGMRMLLGGPPEDRDRFSKAA
jgi:hypothetical protein